jgi:hypothetical protein
MDAFSSVNAYISRLAPWMQVRCNEVRKLILTYPEIIERFRYNIPFYDYNGMMLYITLFEKKKLIVGFCNGHMIKDKHGYLHNSKGQTVIRHFDLFEEHEPDFEALCDYIEQAIKIKDLKRKKLSS